ncbi:MAG: DNAase [Deltaproteobacteria bacterium HGW-Deltaproteobacteria-17]|nr:MAG: DNAase [Deltaproteobacteria bacterium HGW-Deltaproteobacteria-17]
MIDSHCHLFDAPLREDPDGVLNEAAQAGITGIMVVATWASAWDEIVANRGRVREALPDSRVAAGLHPWFVHEAPGDWATRLEALLPRIDAIGEIGLDRGERAPAMELQEPVFARQLQLAAEAGLPVLVHVVKAHDLVLHHLKENGRNVRGIIHAFSGSPEDARAYIERGFLLGIGGGITRENAHRLRRVVSKIPLESLVLETDSPYLGTETVPAGASRPVHVLQVAGKLAELFGVPLETVRSVTSAGFSNLWERA